MEETETQILLLRVAEGHAAAGDELYGLVYDELHRLAQKLIVGERPGHTLQATALVNEAWLRLSGGSPAPVENRRHFIRLAARAMRRVLVDHARAHAAGKRGGGRHPEPLTGALAFYEERQVDLLALDEVLVKLGDEDPELLRIVELRYFAGLTLEETAASIGKTVRQVHLAWTFARGWLRRELERGTA